MTIRVLVLWYNDCFRDAQCQELLMVLTVYLHNVTGVDDEGILFVECIPCDCYLHNDIVMMGIICISTFICTISHLSLETI